MKRIVLTGGGTAGHVTPHLALIPKLQAAGLELHYVGQATGIERQLIEPLDIPFHPISTGKLRRYFDWQNLTDIFRVFWGTVQAYHLIRTLRPDVVFSKGGFVACPLVWAAWANHVPVIAHESDMTPGLANKLSAPFVTQVCYSFPETAAYISAEKGRYTGIPIRQSLLAGEAATGRAHCGFDGDQPVLLVMGGSQGAAVINQAVRRALEPLLSQFKVCHLCGQEGLDPVLDNVSGYKQFAYVNQELPHLYAMADVVVSRAGATTLFELLALRKPSLLISLSLKASRGDQLLNARSFVKRGFSQMLDEDNLNTTTLVEAVTQTYANRSQMIEVMQAVDKRNAVEQVMALIMAAVQGGLRS